MSTTGPPASVLPAPRRPRAAPAPRSSTPSCPKHYRSWETIIILLAKTKRVKQLSFKWKTRAHLGFNVHLYSVLCGRLTFYPAIFSSIPSRNRKEFRIGYGVQITKSGRGATFIPCPLRRWAVRGGGARTYREPLKWAITPITFRWPLEVGEQWN